MGVTSPAHRDGPRTPRTIRSGGNPATGQPEWCVITGISYSAARDYKCIDVSVNRQGAQEMLNIQVVAK